ncbi:hypothetical protein [Streptomyces sp. NPDC051162]|uniref:hypothetical protein n=1 Tax=unclassified Streptomyces TaxID=2593676 RepID=UPI003447CF3C
MPKRATAAEAPAAVDVGVGGTVANTVSPTASAPTRPSATAPAPYSATVVVFKNEK